MSTRFAPLVVCLLVLSLLAGTIPEAGAQGVALSGVGPVNRSMAGAATAAPIDSAGALLWNPASIGSLPSSEMTMAMELLLPTEKVSSTIQAGALGGGFPPVTLSGSTEGEPGVMPIPVAAFVQKGKDSPWSYGLGMFGIGGFRVNYPASLTNPILTPPPPAGLGLGRLDAEAQYFQLVPTLCCAVTERLSIGFAPTVTMSRIMADPLFLASPDDAGGNGFATYPAGSGSRYTWGGGFQVGAFYVTESCWQLGLAFKSKQWFEKTRFNTADELGRPRTVAVQVDYPMILSLGAAYAGWERLLVACDVRFFDYANTAGFGDPVGFDATGRVTGLGWDSVVSVHTGLQYQVGPRLTLRGGYQFNDNPIGSEATFFNVSSPLVIQHVASVGCSYQLSDNLLVSAAYLHGFAGEVSGPIELPGVGALAGTSVTSRVSADALGVGATVRY